MKSRPVLAAAVAVTFSVAAVTAAVGATTHIFTSAEADTQVGKVSPVPPTAPPVVERHVVDVIDPAPPAEAPAPTPTLPAARPTAPAPTHSTSAPTVAAPSVTAVPTPAPAPQPPHRTETEPGDD